MPSSPQLDAEVERFHRSNEQEFHRLLICDYAVDPTARLSGWERFNNPARPHGAHDGERPYEALREKQ